MKYSVLVWIAVLFLCVWGQPSVAQFANEEDDAAEVEEQQSEESMKLEPEGAGITEHEGK